MPSTKLVEVVPVVLEKHPDPDTTALSIVRVYGYVCVARTEDWVGVDKAAYLPVDSVVPERPEFDFLGKHRRIKAKRLRGVFSEGLLMPAPEGADIGDDVTEKMGVTFFDPNDWSEQRQKTASGRFVAGDTASPPPGPANELEYTGIENIKKFMNSLNPGEEVIATEKVHGANVRVTWREGELHVGSHYRWVKERHGHSVFVKKDEETGLYMARVPELDGCIATAATEGEAAELAKRAAETFINAAVAEGREVPKRDTKKSDPWEAARSAGLEEKAKLLPESSILFGEAYGRVQPMKYGIPNEVRFLAFDIFSPQLGTYLDFDEFYKICDTLNIPMAPVVYRGPFDLDLLKKLAEEDSTVALLGSKHDREGLVIRPAKERHHHHGGRIVLKLISERYRLGKHS